MPADSADQGGWGSQAHDRSTAAFDATKVDDLERFMSDLPTPIDHVLVSAGGPYYAPLLETDFEQARHSVDEHLWLALHLGRLAVDKVRPGGSLLFMSGTGARRTRVGLGLASAMTTALAVHLMTNTALTGATYDIDGGQQLL